jgi:hypothetical protein
MGKAGVSVAALRCLHMVRHVDLHEFGGLTLAGTTRALRKTGYMKKARRLIAIGLLD